MIDKSGWGPGPWQDEPDEYTWQDPISGYWCRILRIEFSGCLNGYVGIPEYENAWGKQCDDYDVDVHGDVTYAEIENEHINFLDATGNRPQVWWVVGFDTVHSRDYTPALSTASRALFTRITAYRDFTYVLEQTENLARQLKGIPS